MAFSDQRFSTRLNLQGLIPPYGVDPKPKQTKSIEKYFEFSASTFKEFL
jgi:hypothetical protein